jgi:hypothetical protein
MPIRPMRTIFAVALAAAVQSAGAEPAAPYYQTFHIAPIGLWNSSTVPQFRGSMLQDLAGVEPRYVRLGVCEGAGIFLESTQGAYYDYIYEPSTPPYNEGEDRGWEVDRLSQLAQDVDVPWGVHVNGMPWGDLGDQSLDMLHNFLEKYDAGDGPGSFLQRDRQGRIRSGTFTNPAINERTDLLGALEMQLTLSPYATVLRQYWERNLRQAVRLIQFQRDLHPDLVLFLSGSSEVGQGIHANVDYCDYSRWSAAEFRDWLLGGGIYAGRAQYASLDALNTAFGESSPAFGIVPEGFPHTAQSFAVMTPPTVTDAGDPFINPSTKRGRWFLKWHEFRVHQAQAMVARQGEISVECGWNPDRVFGHQTADKPIPTDGSNLPNVGNFAIKFAGPYTTTYAPLMGNGITTYQDSEDSDLFEAMRANDKSWGIFEYNPVRLVNGLIEPGSLDYARNSLAVLRASHAHIISPFLWDGGFFGGLAPYTIRTRPAEQALREFVTDQGNVPATIAERWEVNPESRSIVWRMSATSDIASSSGVASLSESSGRLFGFTTTATPELTLALPSAGIQAIEYGELALRIQSTRAESAAFAWTDGKGTSHQRTFPLVAGWNLVRMNLADAPGWQSGIIQSLRVRPAAATGASFFLDWVRLEPTFAWPMDAAGEISGVNGFTGGGIVSGGSFTGTGDATGDGYFFLSTDKPAWTDADRVVVDTTRYRRLEIALTASQATTGQLFWGRRGTTVTPSAGIPIAAGTQRVQFPLSAEPQWSGLATQLRLDPINAPGVEVSIDSVRFVEPLLRPIPLVDDLIINTEFPLLRWDAPLETVAVQYDLQIANTFDFAIPIVSRQGLATTQYIHDGSPRLPNGDYWWRVRSRSASGSSAWSVPMPLHLRKWTFHDVRDLYATSGPALYRPADMTPPSVSNGVLSATAIDTDGNSIISPYFAFNSGADIGRGTNSANYTRLRVRLRLTGGSGGNGTPQVFFFAEDTQNFHSIVLPAIPRDGVWRVLDVDMTTSPNWSGAIKLVRLDPTFGRGNYNFELDWAELVPASAPIIETDTSTTRWGIR